jgi:hypothetical protein
VLERGVLVEPIRATYRPKKEPTPNIHEFFERTFSSQSPITPRDNAEPDPKPAPLIKATPFVIRDPSLISRREFLFASHYLRKYATATFGAGGGGKSAHAVTEALSMATAGLSYLTISRGLFVFGMSTPRILQKKLSGASLER